MNQPSLENYGRRYSPDERKLAMRLRGKNTYDEIAERMGRTAGGLNGFYNRADRLKRKTTASIGLDPQIKRLVDEGYRARVTGHLISTCPYSDERELGRACAWKAGWHDADIEDGEPQS